MGVDVEGHGRRRVAEPGSHRAHVGTRAHQPGGGEVPQLVEVDGHGRIESCPEPADVDTHRLGTEVRAAAVVRQQPAVIEGLDALLALGYSDLVPPEDLKAEWPQCHHPGLARLRGADDRTALARDDRPGDRERASHLVDVGPLAVSYTHLTLPTIYSV